MSHEFLAEFATADIAFRATGKTVEEVFRSAADAVMNAMIENPASIEALQRRAFRMEDSALDLLLFNYLGEFVFYKDSEQLLLRPGHLEIQEYAQGYLLTGEAQGEKLDPNRHLQRVDVKAITLHQFSLTQTSDGWSAFVILDI